MPPTCSPEHSELATNSTKLQHYVEALEAAFGHPARVFGILEIGSLMAKISSTENPFFAHCRVYLGSVITMDQFVVSTEMDTITMTQLTFAQTPEATTPLVTVEMVTAALAHLNREQLRDLWQFVQFLDYKASVAEDEAKEEDGRSWVAVQPHKTHKMRHREEEFLYLRPKQARKPTDKDLPREEVIRRLLASGFVRPPEEYDSPAAQEWLSLSEEERQQHIKEMNEMYFPDSPASTYIIESRR